MSPFMTDGSGWLELRDLASDPNSNGQDQFMAPDPNSNGQDQFFKAATNSTNQQMIINQLRFEAAKSIRTSTIILATFNAIAAFATAMGILYDNYSREKRNNRDFRFRHHGFSFVRPGEVYPLVLSIGIIIQSTVFAAAQSTGLEEFFTRGCTLISQVMLPALFLVPYIQLVFAGEITTRALRSKPFPPRCKWAVTICLTVISLLTLTNFLVADFIRVNEFCFASLFFFIAKYATGCFGLFTGIIIALSACAVAIFVRLHRSNKIEVTERVTASRMVYYLALAIISNGFMLPFFYCLAFPHGDMNAQTLTLSMIASVVANLSGVMTGGLYLFLKSNVLSTIGPRDKLDEYERRRLKHTIRYGTGDDDADDDAITQVSGSGSLRRTGSDASFISNEKVEEASNTVRGSSTPSIASSQRPNPLRSNAFYPSTNIPRLPEPAQAPTGSIGHMRKRSYNIFPSLPSSKSSATLLPATTYSPHSNGRPIDSLKPPPSLHKLMGRHRRDSSMISTATVQIGLRLSSVDGMLSRSCPATAPESDVISLNCPIEPAKSASPSRPSPLKWKTPADVEDATIPDFSPKRDPVKSARMKTLPPVPNLPGESAQAEVEEEDAELLSPCVYSPVSPTKARLPSPKGVGVAMAATRYNNGSPTSPHGSTTLPPRRATGDSPVLPADPKAEWI